MVKKKDEEIAGEEEKLKGDYSEKFEEKKIEKKIKKFFSTSDRPQPKKKIATLTTRDLDADGKLIKKRRFNNE